MIANEAATPGAVSRRQLIFRGNAAARASDAEQISTALPGRVRCAVAEGSCSGARAGPSYDRRGCRSPGTPQATTTLDSGIFGMS